MSRLLRLDLDGEALLGIPAGPRHNQYSLAQLGAVVQSDGWLVNDFDEKHPPTIHTWRFSGYRHHKDQVFVVGPWTDGLTLDQALAEQPSRSCRMQHLSVAVATLSEQVDFGGPIQGDGVVFTDDGALLFLPPVVMHRLNSVKSPAERLTSVERYLHPHRTGPDQLSFALGVAVYRVLCGRYPFDGDSEEEMHDQVRRLRVVSPRTYQPKVPVKLCDAVLASLGQGKENAPTLTHWRKLLAGPPAAETLTKLEEPTPEALQEVAIEDKQTRRRFARTRFLDRNWRRLLGWGAGAAVALAILVPIVGRALAPPVTRGLGPLEVIELFYDSVNAFNTEPMEDAVTGHAGRGLINETLYIFLESRMAIGNQGGSQVISAPEWDGVGRPEDPPFRVYGITDLKIRQEQNELNPVFVAHYFFWTPNIGEVVSQMNPPGLVVTERLWLLWTGKDWAIERMETLERETVPPKALETDEAAKQGGDSS